MIRDFKFRAWDMVDGMKSFVFDSLVLNLVSIDHGVYDVPIMQYTGLNDRNGKRVFESDIVENEHSIYLIKWDEKKAQYKAKIISTKSVLTKHCEFPLWQYVNEDGKCRFSVIGNIYENPELLTKED